MPRASHSPIGWSPSRRGDVVLDLDGPILDGSVRHHACYAAILERHGRECLPRDTYWELKRNKRDRREQLAATGCADLYDEYLDAWLGSIESPEMLSLDQLQPGAEAALLRLSHHGHRLLLATARRDRRALTAQLDSLGLGSVFARVAVVDPTQDVARAKAAAVLAEGGVAPWSAFVGDTEADILAGQALGCHTVALACGIRTAALLAQSSPSELHEDLRAWTERWFPTHGFDDD